MKAIILILWFCLYFINSFAQDLIDPYKDFDLKNIITDIKYPPSSGYNAPNPNNFSYYPMFRSTTHCSNYTGEYMFYLHEHPWVKSSVINNAKSYSIEVVSFPFTTPCWDQPSSCAYPGYGSNTERVLMMPDDLYTSGTNSWNHLHRIYEDDFIQSPLGVYEWSLPNLLVSRQFVLDYTHAMFAFNGGLLPHTILKHTINLHCNSSLNSDIVDSFTFYYDNTRGAMQTYPFKADNTDDNVGCDMWDVVFTPEVLVDPDEVNNVNYDIDENEGWFEGGTVEFYPFAESNNPLCPVYDPPFGNPFGSTFYSNNVIERRLYNYQYPYPSPYSLNSNLLKGVNARDLAGYTLNNITNNLEKRDGLPHTYTVNTSFDLSIINPTLQTIFNPSNVIITPDPLDPPGTNAPINVIFPESYTFKTILGRYPSYQQVLDANADPQNGGSLSDLREVSVPVNAADLPQSPGTTISDYPEVMWDNPSTVDPNGFYFDERYGYYQVQRNASLTIESCVKIFDAKLSVYPGGTIEFIDYPTNYGYENITISSVNNFGRYKIRGEGGAVLRNYENIQYVQNGNIIQERPLHYIAWDIFEVGLDVDPNEDQPTGNYSIMTGADVTFQTEGYIHLTNGFSVQGGDFHALVSTTIPSAPACTPSNRFAFGTNPTLSINSQSAVLNYNANCFPNPNNGKWTLEADNLDSYVITDVMGQEIEYRTNINSNSTQIKLNNYTKGVLFVNVTSVEGKTDVVKIIVE